MRKKVKCTRCGYSMPITYGSKANCSGIYARCKGRACKKEFEIKIKDGEQIR